MFYTIRKEVVKLPPQDSELQYRLIRRDTARRNFDNAKAALDAAAQQRNTIQSIYGPQLDFLKDAIPNLKTNMRYSFEQASYAYSNGNKAGARDFSEQGKQEKAELQQLYAQKNEALDQVKAVGEQFRQALEHFQACKAEFFAARDAVKERYDQLKAENERKRLEREARYQQQRQNKLLGTGRIPKMLGPGSQEEREWWTKYGKATFDKDTGLDQMNFFAGYKGDTNQRTKVHIAVNEEGDIVFIRDVTGEVLYDRKNNIGHLPPDLDFSK